LIGNKGYLNLDVFNCTFTRNYGLMSGTGGAFVIEGMQNEELA